MPTAQPVAMIEGNAALQRIHLCAPLSSHTLSLDLLIGATAHVKIEPNSRSELAKHRDLRGLERGARHRGAKLEGWKWRPVLGYERGAHLGV